MNSNTADTQPLDVERLLAEYGDGLLRMCLLYLHDYQLAEDAVQETIWLACQNWHQFRGRCSERTWLSKIAVNVCRSQLRTGWFQRVMTQETLPEAAYEDRFPDDTVCRAVAGLKPRYREVILLYYYQELSTKEIAQALGIRTSAVTVRLSRARKMLETKLKGWYFDE